MTTTTKTSAPTWGLFQDSTLFATSPVTVNIGASNALMPATPPSAQPASVDAQQGAFVEPKAPVAPAAYVAPDLGLRNPLAPHSQFENDLHLSLETRGATDVVAADPKGLSKPKVLITVGIAGVSALILGGAFLFKGAPTALPVAHAPAPNRAVIEALKRPVGTPVLPAAPAGPPTTQGVDINSTAAIATVHGDIDLVLQGAPIDPVDQNCANEQLTSYTKALCGAVSPTKFFKCAPDSLHWDPRIPGCESV